MIGEIEQAMIDRVAAVNGEGAGKLGYLLKQVASYGGEFDEGGREVWRNSPALFFRWTGEWAPPESLGDNAWRYHASFAAVIAAKQLRNEKARRHGAAGEVGSYQILTDLRAALVGRTLGLEIRALEPGDARPLFNKRVDDAKISVMVAEFRTAYVGEPPAPSGLDDFATFHADWDIPPHGDHDTVPLPAGEADAEDTVTLETE
jgi:phage gp37-like protein